MGSNRCNKKSKEKTHDSPSLKVRKGLEIEGYPVEGLSIGGQETCVIFPTLKMAFDIGRCPQRAISQDFLFISHGHMDHIVRFLVLLLCIMPLTDLFADDIWWHMNVLMQVSSIVLVVRIPYYNWFLLVH